MTAEQIRQEEQEQEMLRAKMREISGVFKRGLEGGALSKRAEQAVANYVGREEEATPGGARVFIVKITFRNRERNCRIIVGGKMVNDLDVEQGRIFCFTNDVVDYVERAIKQTIDAWEEEKRLDGR